MTEAELQAKVIDLAHACGWRVAHFRPAQTQRGWRTPVSADGKGFPDLVLVGPRVIFAELKAKRGRMSPEQNAWGEWLCGAGAEWRLWRPDDWPEIVAELSQGRAAA